MTTQMKICFGVVWENIEQIIIQLQKNYMSQYVQYILLNTYIHTKI